LLHLVASKEVSERIAAILRGQASPPMIESDASQEMQPTSTDFPIGEDPQAQPEHQQDDGPINLYQPAPE
jgi:hypothetical protein